MSGRLARREMRAAWLFLAPTLIALALVALWPLARTLFFSITDAELDDPASYAFVGLQNFLAVAQDRQWWRAVGNTVLFTAVSVSIETLLGLGIALLLNAALPGRGALRAAILIPWSIPVVVSAKIWEWMLHDQFGVINKLLIGLGILDKGLAWTADPALAMGVIIFVDVWITTPFMVLLILAGLQTIPAEMMEAAFVDGVPWWKRFWSLTLPMLRPAIGVAVLFRVLDAMRMFDLSYILAGNGERTMTVSIYARNQLISFQALGMGSAASTCVFLVIGLVAVLIIGALRLDRATAR
ncbi:carbohydrate ABC transporter permease [Labrys wisconsinensis]|uniref:Trehalose/maltose transport system permease protein n=1 Tax=Labrys wisconsinensis TaxID=425677 RepID=A0ABU0J0W3_9HYPH|nr:sugar ABC transporter permease [Labrys wisconsinensis]MDQ0467902.1 trehalose/maltose transport system permease protein [Labrys wisconsinensis]